jgi:outer membrane protein assembly factor BamB
MKDRARYTVTNTCTKDGGATLLSGTDLHVVARTGRHNGQTHHAMLTPRCPNGEERVVTTLDAELFFPRRTAAQLLAVSQAGTSLRVHGLDARTGQQVWTFSVSNETSTGGTGGGQAAITDGYIFLRLGNTLYCLG